MRVKDLTGLRLGKLTVLSLAYKKNGAHWRCVCDCGGESIVRGSVLNSGSTKSCGCGSRQQAVDNCRTSAAGRHLLIPHRRKLQEMLRNMRSRCYDPANKRWERYGGRGIKICDEWLLDNRAFYAWATANCFAPGLEIDRCDYNGNYSPENCRFVTDKVQANNTSRNNYVTWNEETLTVAGWADKLGVRRQALQHRFTRGWLTKRALTQTFRGRE